MVVVIGSTVRAELLDVLRVHEDWPIVDQMRVDEIHPPCAVLLRECQVQGNTFTGRMLAFTLQLVVDPSSSYEQADRLLDAVTTGELFTALNAAATTYTGEAWGSLLVRDDQQVSIREEVIGQTLCLVADLTLEVYD